MATTRLIKHHISKGQTILESIKDRFDYGKNPLKTRGGELIAAYMCDPETADAEFLLSKAKYKAITGRVQKKDEDVLCYQIRQSFACGEIDHEGALEIGYETAMRWTKGKHAFLWYRILTGRTRMFIFITIPQPLIVPGSLGIFSARGGRSGDYPTEYVLKMIYRLSAIRNSKARENSNITARG